jgi:uncharacterized protein
MRSKLLAAGTERTFAVIFEAGDEVMSGLKTFAKEHRPRSAHFTAIGAFSDVVLAYFDVTIKQYRKIPLMEQVEVLTLAGDIAWDNDREPVIHAHVVIGRSDGNARGGHLMEAHVRPTLELILNESPEHLARVYDPACGLALIRL